jgi:hypothetical protein
MRLESLSSVGVCFTSPWGSRVCATLTEATGGRYPDAAEGYPKAAEILVGAQPF